MDITTTNTTDSIISNLSEYDDFLNAYIQIDQAANNVSWIKADVLVAMSNKLGNESLKELSKELGENYSTLVSYIRVARAFPMESRSEKAPFSAHFQASLSDRFNSTAQEFDGKNRFDWINKAADDNMSTRSLARAINEEKDLQKEISEPSEASKLAIIIRKNIATVVKMADDGNQNSLSLLFRIKELLESYG